MKILAARIAGPGRPPLAPAQHVVIPVSLDARADVGRVGRRHVRLRHAERGANFALQQRHEPLPLDLLARVAHERLHVAGVGGRAVERLGPDGGPAHQLAQRGVLEVGEPGAVLALGQEEIPQPLRLRLRLQRLHDRHRLPPVSLGHLPCRDRLGGKDVLVHEAAHVCVDIAGAFARLEDHSGCSQQRCRRHCSRLLRRIVAAASHRLSVILWRYGRQRIRAARRRGNDSARVTDVIAAKWSWRERGAGVRG